MEAENLLKFLKECIEAYSDNLEPIITPTKGDPTEKQYDVSLIIFEKVKDGRIPRFTINVKDNLNIDGLSTKFGRVRGVNKN